MKKEIKDIVNDKTANDKPAESSAKKITRKEAIKKTGYIAVSAATMMILLSNPFKAQAAETSPDTVSPWTPPGG